MVSPMQQVPPMGFSFREYLGGGVPVFLEDWKIGFLNVKNEYLGKITGVMKTEDMKINSLKIWGSQKAKIKCEERILKCEDSEADTP